MDRAPYASASYRWRAWELPSRLPSTQAEPSRRGPWRPGRSYSGALHLDARNHARSTVCGSTADGMGAGESGELLVQQCKCRMAPDSVGSGAMRFASSGRKQQPSCGAFYDRHGHLQDDLNRLSNFAHDALLPPGGGCLVP